MLINNSQRARVAMLALVIGVMLALALPVRAVSYSWTNTVAGSTGYWTNGILWGNILETTYPGSAAGDSAFLTNQFSGTYTNILNFGLANSISTLAVSNPLGQAWLVVTNATLANDTFALGSGGRLRVDNGGRLNNTTAFTMTGTNGAVTINSGGTLSANSSIAISPTPGDLNTFTISGGSVFVTNAASTAQLLVGLAGGGRGILTFNSGTLYVNQLISTNNFPAAANLPTNSWFISVGTGATLITSNAANALASRIVLPENQNFNVNGTWIMLGGTNQVKSYSTGSSTTAGNFNQNANGSTIIVSNSAKMYNELARRWDLDGPNALLLVTGPGSVVSNGGLNASMIISVNSTTNNRVIIQDGGAFVSRGALSVGFNNVSSNNMLLVTDPGSTFTNAGLTVYGPNNAFIVSNQATAYISAAIGDGASPNGGKIIVTGTGSVLTVAGQFNLGHFDWGRNNSLVISDGGVVSDLSTILLGGRGGQVGGVASNNTITVTDPGSRFVAGPLMIGGDGAGVNRTNNSFNGITVSNGAFMTSASARLGQTSDSSALHGGNNSNYVVVTGLGSAWTNTGLLIIGNTNMVGNYVSVTDGAKYVGGGAVTVGYGGSSNRLEVIGTANASSFSNNALITVGQNRGGYNSMLITNAQVLSTTLTVGNAGSSNNSVTVNGTTLWNLQGNLLTVGGAAASNNTLTINAGASVTGVTRVAVGATATAYNNAVLVNGGLLEANTLSNFIGSAGNTISNVAGIYQFTTSAPTITPNGFGNIAITDGTISFRATGAGNVATNAVNQINNIRFAGANTFMLNNASNTAATVSQKYTFDAIPGNPSNYVNLVMVNGPTAYGNANGSDITIGSAGTFLASNTVAIIAGTMTNNGMAEIVDATVNFQSALHVAGTLTLRNGFVTGSAAKTIAGTLRGNGTVVGDATITGDLSPGLSLGTLVFSNNLTLAGSYQADFGDGGNDQLIVVGALTLSGATLDLTAVGGVTGEAYVIASYGDLFGTFSVTNGMPVGYTVDYNYNGASQIAIVVVPEPGTMALVVCGLVASWLMCRQRSRRSSHS